VPADSVDLDVLGDALHTKWTDFENFAFLQGYDILRLEPECVIEPRLRVLVNLLYKVPGASPTEDTAQLKVKDREYGGSWCRRGGQGAFFMLARKWDRIDKQVESSGGSLERAIEKDKRAEGILDDLGDLRRYLVLCVAYREERRTCP
jgi:hypothetical protein